MDDLTFAYEYLVLVPAGDRRRRPLRYRVTGVVVAADADRAYALLVMRCIRACGVAPSGLRLVVIC